MAVIIELGMLVMYCMQFVMSVSMVSCCGVSWCYVYVGCGDVLEVFGCIFRSCVSVLSVLMVCGVLMCVNVVSDLGDESASLLVFSVCADDSVVLYFGCPGCKELILYGHSNQQFICQAGMGFEPRTFPVS